MHTWACSRARGQVDAEELVALEAYANAFVDANCEQRPDNYDEVRSGQWAQ